MTDAIYTDFASAFDVVEVSVNLKKFEAYGINGALLSWLEPYLTNRKQYVKSNNRISNMIEVTSGVGQGFHCYLLYL